MIRSFVNAFRGIRFAFLQERNFRIHVSALVVAICLGFYFGIRAWEWCVILLTGGWVISLELINTAIERLTDLAEPAQNPLAGKIKDISAAAVLISAIVSALLGIIIFWKYIV